MKKWIVLICIGILSCEDSEDDFGTQDQILLLSDREVVCPGQTAMLRLFSTVSNREISISEFAFDPLASGVGSISSNGLYTAPSSFTSSQIEISGTFRSKTKLSLKINTSNGPNSEQGGVEISPFGFFNADEGRPYFFWSDGSVVLGTPRHLTQTLQKFEISKYTGQGVLQWKKDLGAGEAKFVEVLNDKIYAAGTLSELGGAVFNVILLFDLYGNLVWEKKMPTTPQHVFSGFQVDTQGNFYISTYTNGNAFITSLAKYNLLGENVWDIEPGSGFREIFIFPDGNVVAKSEEGWGGQPILTFFNSSGLLLQKEKTEFTGVNFKGPNNTFGVGYEIPGNESFSIYFDLFASDGKKTLNRQRIVTDQSFSGRLSNPAEKKRAPAGFNKFFSDETDKVHVLQAGFWGNYDFLISNSTSQKEWIWWSENKARTAEGVLYPLQILEEEKNLILLAHSNGELYQFRLGKDYSFDDCLRQSYWNKLDMF